MSDAIKIQVGESDYTGWKSVSVRRSMEALTGSFSMTTVDRWALNDEAWVLFPGRFCRIVIGQESILEGYIDKVSPVLTTRNHTISVSGRDKTADLVDCSLSGKWNNIDILQLAKNMATPFGINVSSEVPLGARFPEWEIDAGETVFDSLSKAAQKRHVLLLTGRIGNLIITNTGNESAGDRLIMGKNVLSASGDYDFTDRFSSYTVKGQNKTEKIGWKLKTISTKGEAEDEEVTRHRPKIIKGQGIISTKDAQNRARWEANIRAAKSFKASVDVKGFRQTTGALWDVNLLVDVDIPQLLLLGSMLISAIEYRQSNEGGSSTTMELTRPDAYVDEPTKVVRKIRYLGW